MLCDSVCSVLIIVRPSFFLLSFLLFLPLLLLLPLSLPVTLPSLLEMGIMWVMCSILGRAGWKTDRHGEWKRGGKRLRTNVVVGTRRHLSKKLIRWFYLVVLLEMIIVALRLLPLLWRLKLSLHRHHLPQKKLMMNPPPPPSQTQVNVVTIY